MRLLRSVRSALPAALVPLLCLAATAPAQTLVTDKDDYAPGETVYFVGTGFQPGENIAMALQVEDYNEKQLDYAVGGIMVDTAGEFTATWLVPQEALDTLITATAVGLSSKRVASVKFTDSDGFLFESNAELIPNGNSVTVRVSLQGSIGAGSGFYIFKDTVDACLTNVADASDVVSVTLDHISGGISGSCCGPTSLGGTSTYEGAVTLPAGQTYKFTKVSAGMAIGIPGGPAPFPGFPPTPAQCLQIGVRLHSFDGPTTDTGEGEPCPENVPPTLELDDLDLGQLVGCLTANGFTKDVTVAEADFLPVAADADGDPVAVTFQGPSNFTFTGPGLMSCTVTFTATDNPSARNTANCPTLTPLSVTETAVVTARIVYDFDGPAAPLAPGEAMLNKRGRTIPLKFTLRDCNGNEVCPDNSNLFDTEADKPFLDVTAVSMMSPGGDPVTEDSGAANDNGVLFRYSGTCGTDGKWIYNLSTKGPGWTAGVLYRAAVSLNDGTTRDV